MHRNCAQKVVNRDIKLENTLLDREDDKLAGLPAPLIKVTDFGLSKHEAAQGQPVSFVGTPAYMAPEVRGAMSMRKCVCAFNHWHACLRGARNAVPLVGRVSTWLMKGI